ncbi:MAG: DNA metabolism protein [Lachnospiraceae bacterium]|nr:DNA metabolism protein [Lachnospiraceae bacterium]
MYIFLCEDSPEGIFTGIYDAWDSRYGHKNIHLKIEKEIDNYELFSTYLTVIPDPEKSEKVVRTLQKKFGMEVWSSLYEAVICNGQPLNRKHQMDKADAIYKTIVFGLSLPDGRRLMDYLGEPYIHQVFLLSRSSFNEAHHLLGFLRFQELKSGVLFARIHPKNDILSLLAEHFCDRLPQENFIIYDAEHNKAALHKKGSTYVLTDASDINPSFIKDYSSMELEYQRLWKKFFESIAVEARKNQNLQNQNILKRFQKDVVEFQ